MDAQGRALNGSQTLAFALYDDGGNQLWSSLPQTVNVSDGFFAVTLGDVSVSWNSLRFDQAYTIGVKVNDESEMMPRLPLASAPYALFAADIPNGKYWAAGGNAGTNPDFQFLGTTDNQPLEIRVGGLRAFRFEPGSNIIGGAYNGVTTGVSGGVLTGGGLDTTGTFAAFPAPNRVTDGGGVVVGGFDNVAGNDNANARDTHAAVVVGGHLNRASGSDSFVGGGYNNVASGVGSTVSGGKYNEAAGDYSFAAGYGARVSGSRTFVWDTESGHNWTTDDSFIVVAPGGIDFRTRGDLKANLLLHSNGGSDGKMLETSTGAYLTTGGVWANASDRAQKENFASVNSRGVLESLAALPISTWNYKSESTSVRHIGPMAQDFAAAFGMGQDDTHISTVDADGVALAAMQGLYQVVKEKDAENAVLRRQVADLTVRIEHLEYAMSANAH